MLTITVKDGRAFASGEIIVAGSVLYPKVKFCLPDEWNTLTVTAQFAGSNKTVDLVAVKPDTEYSIPWECITDAGELSIAVKGYAGDECRTVVYTNVRVHESNLSESAGTPEEPSPDKYEQIMGMLRSVTEHDEKLDAVIEEARDGVAQVEQLANEMGRLTEKDWDQNDETAPDYIKNRPMYRYKTDETYTVTFKKGDTPFNTQNWRELGLIEKNVTKFGTEYALSCGSDTISIPSGQYYHSAAMVAGDKFIDMSGGFTVSWKMGDNNWNVASPPSDVLGPYNTKFQIGDLIIIATRGASSGTEYTGNAKVYMVKSDEKNGDAVVKGLSWDTPKSFGAYGTVLASYDVKNPVTGSTPYYGNYKRDYSLTVGNGKATLSMNGKVIMRDIDVSGIGFNSVNFVVSATCGYSGGAIFSNLNLIASGRGNDGIMVFTAEQKAWLEERLNNSTKSTRYFDQFNMNLTVFDDVSAFIPDTMSSNNDGVWIFVLADGDDRINMINDIRGCFIGQYTDGVATVNQLNSLGLFASGTTIIFCNKQNAYKPLDEQYLPQTVATKSYVDSAVSRSGGNYELILTVPTTETASNFHINKDADGNSLSLKAVAIEYNGTANGSACLTELNNGALQFSMDFSEKKVGVLFGIPLTDDKYVYCLSDSAPDNITPNGNVNRIFAGIKSFTVTDIWFRGEVPAGASVKIYGIKD
ncbi:MAG: hypothetical protein PUB05_03915 [Firmicutes bacterium]|nr:hypothetical protein [Bacillota bacterium]